MGNIVPNLVIILAYILIYIVVYINITILVPNIVQFPGFDTCIGLYKTMSLENTLCNI